MQKKILIITSIFDLTSDYLINTYNNIEFLRLNVDQFESYKILVNENDVIIKTTNWEYQVSDIDAIYYRKPSLPNLEKVIEKEYIPFVHKEIFSLIEGIVESFSRKCLSKPSVLRVANNKIVQCLMAKKIGFKMPSVRITNSPEWAKSSSCTNSIVKPISIGTITKKDSQIAVQTNILNNQIPMNTLEYCPAYFQDFIPKDYDVRITIVGDNVFPVKINSENNVDWRRRDNNVSYETINIPSKITSQCKKMLSNFNLKFGCFDFVVKDSVYYFLEVNANGQWAWLEGELGTNISGAIIKELL